MRGGKGLGKGGCCPPPTMERIAAQQPDKAIHTVEDFASGFYTVKPAAAALHMPKQPLTGYEGRVMKNLCWLPMVSAASGKSNTDVLKVIYGFDVTDEECPDNREDPSYILSTHFGAECSCLTEDEIYTTSNCKEYIKADVWSYILEAVESSRPIMLLARSQSYRTYVHCLMVAGVCKEGFGMLVTDPCERGVLKAEMKCAPGLYSSDSDSCGSLELHVYSDDCIERYRIVGITVTEDGSK